VIPKGTRTREGERERKERKGWSEAAGTRAKGGENSLYCIVRVRFDVLLGQDRRFIYMYKKCSLSISNTARGSRNKSD